MTKSVNSGDTLRDISSSVSNVQEGKEHEISNKTNQVAIDHLTTATRAIIIPAESSKISQSENIDAKQLLRSNSNTEKLIEPELVNMRNINQKIENLHKVIKDWEYSASRGFPVISKYVLNKAKDRLQNLTEASNKLLNLMEKVNQHLAKNQSFEACAKCGQEMPKAYAAYCEALKEYKIIDREIAAIFKYADHELHIDDAHVKDPLSAVNKLNHLAGTEFQHEIIFSIKDLISIGKTYKNYMALFQLADKAKGKVEALLQSEKELSDQLSNNIKHLSNEQNPDINYGAALIKAKKACIATIKNLEETLSFVASGRVQDGINYFASTVSNDVNDYKELATVQKIAEDLGVSHHLNLAQSEQHLLFLQEMHEEAKQVKGINTATLDASILHMKKLIK